MTHMVFLVVNTCLLFCVESLSQEIDQSRHTIHNQVRCNGSVVLTRGGRFASDRLHSALSGIRHRFKNCGDESVAKNPRGYRAKNVSDHFRGLLRSWDTSRSRLVGRCHSSHRTSSSREPPESAANPLTGIPSKIILHCTVQIFPAARAPHPQPL